MTNEHVGNAIGSAHATKSSHRPLILTAKMEAQTFARFQALRSRHYPPERNLVPAHITLFHHLPGSEIDAVSDRLKQVCRGTSPPHATVAGLRSLGNGVAFDLRSDELELLRDELAHAWHTLLIPQDRAWSRPHVTVQNKVTPREAKLLIDELRPHFVPWQFAIEGLILWRYLDGPWQQLKLFRFAG